MRKRSKTEKERYREIRLAAIKQLGGKCARCGFSDWRALQFDHINGGGARDGERGRVHYLRNKIPTGELQLLCANCNQIKRYEKGEGVTMKVENADQAQSLINEARSMKIYNNPNEIRKKRDYAQVN